MRLRSLSSTADSISASRDSARIGKRKTTGISEFLTISQVAELLAVSSRTVRRWIKSGVLPAHRIGGVVRIAEADLAAFLALRRGA